VENGIVRSGEMKLVGEDDASLVEKVVEVLRGLNWAVGDAEAEFD